jgi:hypothetical protein
MPIEGDKGMIDQYNALMTTRTNIGDLLYNFYLLHLQYILITCLHSFIFSQLIGYVSCNYMAD